MNESRRISTTVYHGRRVQVTGVHNAYSRPTGKDSTTYVHDQSGRAAGAPNGRRVAEVEVFRGGGDRHWGRDSNGQT